MTKRDGRLEKFSPKKIEEAVKKAFLSVDGKETERCIAIARNIAQSVASEIDQVKSVEDIQDIVEEKLMTPETKDVARSYIRYRYDREKNRMLSKDLNKRYTEFISLVRGTNEEANKENSNKDTRIIPTMRDYIAGFTCREMAEKFILPKDIVEAHQQGIIHVHDTDYSPSMPMNNCSLVNLEDMLQNGTVISGTMIEKPHSFRTACTIVTQIITQVASSQYGGNTITLSHLAPFVDISRNKIKKEVENEIYNILDFGIYSPGVIKEIVENRLKQEIADGIQTIQYQLITMSTTNGQAPFTSVFMCLGEVPEGQLRNDLAMIIEEVLRQRIKGVKNEKGVYITTAFPKLLYCLDEYNIYEDSEYWYLTKLAAECSTKRLVPDYISAKKMRELKGDVYPCINKTCA